MKEAGADQAASLRLSAGLGRPVLRDTGISAVLGATAAPAAQKTLMPVPGKPQIQGLYTQSPRRVTGPCIMPAVTVAGGIFYLLSFSDSCTYGIVTGEIVLWRSS